jgi:phage terminase small subunit
MTGKQERFCNEYLIDLNVEKAAVRAGYAPKSASHHSYLMMRNPKILERIQALSEARRVRMQLSQDEVVRELMKIAFADITDYANVEEDGGGTGQAVTLKNTADLPVDKTGAVAGIRQGSKGIEIKLYDKLKALELLARHLGMLRDRMEIDDARELQVVFQIPRSGGESGEKTPF